MPPGLVFGPCSAPPPRFKRTKTATRKAWYWSQKEKKRKVWSKSGSERKRKAEVPERKKKREELSRKKKMEDQSKSREQRAKEHEAHEAHQEWRREQERIRVRNVQGNNSMIGDISPPAVPPCSQPAQLPSTPPPRSRANPKGVGQGETGPPMEEEHRRT